MRRSVSIVKRLMDIIMSCVGLFATLPLYPVLAFLIKRDSPGPVFYHQRRVKGLKEGANGELEYETFFMMKFRSMGVNAEAKTGKVLAQKNDPRITKIGRILRKTRLDEIPQFWHVLLGDMSMIGPRPERPELMENLAAAVPFFEERMRFVKPGITGLAQIQLSYSGELSEGDPLYNMRSILTNPYGLEETEGSIADDMRTKMLYDLAYSASLENFWTFLKTDIKIIFATPMVMIFGKGR